MSTSTTSFSSICVSNSDCPEHSQASKSTTLTDTTPGHCVLHARLGYFINGNSLVQVALEAIGVQGMRHCHSSTELDQSVDDTDGCAEDTSLVSFLEDDTCPEGFVHAAVESRLDKLCWVIRSFGLLTAIVFTVAGGSALQLGRAIWTGPSAWTIALWSPIALAALGLFSLLGLALRQQGGRLDGDQLATCLRILSFSAALLMFVYCLEPNVSPDVRQDRFTACILRCIVTEVVSLVGAICKGTLNSTPGKTLSWMLTLICLFAPYEAMSLLLLSDRHYISLSRTVFTALLGLPWVYMWSKFLGKSDDASLRRSALAAVTTVFIFVCWSLRLPLTVGAFSDENQAAVMIHDTLEFMGLYFKNQLGMWVAQIIVVALASLFPQENKVEARREQTDEIFV